MQQKVQTVIDAGSVGVIGVGWLPAIPIIISSVASLIAIAWILQRWYWAAKDRKKKDDS